MINQVTFIDREDELALIDSAINAWGKKRMLYFWAEGGTGKTRLLQEVRHRYQRWDTILFGEKIDRKDITIAVVNEFTQTEWSERFVNGVQESVRAMGIRLIQTDAHFDIDQMAQDLEYIIQQSPDAIIVRLGTDEKLRIGIEQANHAGIPILTVDNYLTNLDMVTSSITTDEHQGAYQASEQLVKDINFRGKVAAMLVKGAALQEKRKELLKSLLAQYSNNIQLIDHWVAMSEEMGQTAYDQTKSLLRQHPDLKAIWVTWDEFTSGVVNALQDEDRADIGVYSFDILSDQDIELMSQPGSPWRATIMIDPSIVGRSIIRLAVSAACRKPIEQHYSMPMQYINQALLRSRQENWQTIWDDFENQLMPRLLMPDIVDFDEYTFRDEQGFALKIADLVGVQYFNDFFQALRYFNEIKSAGVSPELVAKHQADVEKAFILGLEKITTKQRLVLLIDTAEKAREVLHFIIEVVSKIENIAVLIAGRPDEVTIEFLANWPEKPIHFIELPPLNPKASEFYLEEKQKMLHIVLESGLAQKILYWSRGKPILIDLAIEWHARRSPLKWLEEESLDSLPELSTELKKHRQDEFEAHLVRYIASTRSLMDWLILTLAQVYPMDVLMISKLLKVSLEDAENLVKEFQTYVFTKTLPDSRITLHDEMRRLVNTYVWPEVDPDDDRRHKISQSAVIYLKEQIDECKRRIEEIKYDEEMEPQKVLKDLWKWRSLQSYIEELWMLKEQLLRHQLVVELKEGKNLFFDMFEEATRTYRYIPRLQWLDLIEMHLGRLSSEDQYEVLIRKAKAKLDERRYPEAREALNLLIERNDLASAQTADVQIQLANVSIRQGDFYSGIEYFQKAVEISRINNLNSWLVKAENGLGWVYRLTADLESARQHYEIALELAIDENLQHEQSMLYNNLGFLYAYRKDFPNYYDTALRFCKESLRLAQQLENERGIGRAYSALGCITFMGGDIEQSLDYFQKALEIFEPTNDEEWLSTVYAWRGAVYMSTPYHDLDLAERDLLRAKGIGIPKELPMVFSRLGLIYLLREKYDQAEECINQCHELAYNLPDFWYQWVAIRDMARFASYTKQFDRLETLENEMQAYLAQHPKPDARAGGMLHMELGTLSMGQGKVEDAAQHYYDGMKILTYIGPYGGDTPITYLDRLEKDFFINYLSLTPKQIRDIGSRLLKLWRAGNFHILYPDVRAAFSNWTNWQEA